MGSIGDPSGAVTPGWSVGRRCADPAAWQRIASAPEAGSFSSSRESEGGPACGRMKQAGAAPKGCPRQARVPLAAKRGLLAAGVPGDPEEVAGGDADEAVR